MNASLGRLAGRLVACGLLGSAAAGSAPTAVLYSQPLTTSGGPFSNDTQPQRVADDFNIPAGGTINRVTWYGDRFGGTAFSPFIITFYSDLCAGPAAALQSFTGMPTVTGNGALLTTPTVSRFSSS